MEKPRMCIPGFPAAWRLLRLLSILTAFCAACPGRAEVQVLAEHREPAKAAARFEFQNISPPRRSDAASAGTFTLLEGRIDPNSGGLAALNDGELPETEDEPQENFFFAAGSPGGRLLLDLGKVITVKEVNTYSWHRRERSPQVYQLFGADGAAPSFVRQPAPGADLIHAGWTRLAQVDTRLPEQRPGGQCAVSIRNPDGHLGSFRYLIFQVFPTENNDPFGQTFFSEIDVIDAEHSATEEAAPSGLAVSLDTAAAPDLEAWSREKLLPAVTNWYPKLSRLLASDGYEPPSKLTLRFRADMNPSIPAAASGHSVSLNAAWFRRNLQGEAMGSVIHELVHVVQNYGWGQRRNPQATRPPGWVVEGIADYVRWFLYEPVAFGAEITERNFPKARYDSSYRITANFLHWVATIYGHDVISKLNAAAREGTYTEDFWLQQTGVTLQQANDAWRAVHERRLARTHPHPAQ